MVEAVGDGAGVQPGERVYAALFPAGGGFAELALASADRLAPMPGKANFVEAAGLVIGAGTAYEGLIDRGRLQAGETVLITAAAGGVGSAAVQIAAAGLGLSNWPPLSMPANSARRPKRYCRSARPARRWRGSLPGTPEARSRSKSADCARSGRLAW